MRTLTLGLVVAAAALVVVSPALATDESAQPDVQPDVFVVMIDDHAYIPDQRVLERLPAIRERFLVGGLRFSQMYDETPLCCPARATVLTGQHTLHHGVLANDDGGMDPTVTLATALHDAGYHTLMVGKYFTSYSGPKVPPGWDHAVMRKNASEPSFWVDDVATSFAGRHGDDVVREKAVELLRAAPADQPVFAYLTPSAPHREQCRGQGRSEGVRDCDYLPKVMEQDQGAAACAGIPDYKPADYQVVDTGKGPPWGMPPWPDGWPLEPICESLLVVDRMVAELGAVQAERGRPAVWVLLSDNGMSWGRKSYPLKHVPTATRLPFYVDGPEMAVGESDVLLSNIDLAPTLAEIAGADLAIADGSSFLPLLRGEPMAGRDEMLEIMSESDTRNFLGWEALRTREWRYIRWENGERELYDLSADPDELVNLVETEVERADRMDTRLSELVDASAGD